MFETLFSDPGAQRRSYIARADRGRPAPGESDTEFRLDKAKGRSYSVAKTSKSYPQTGELCFHFS